MSAMFSAVRRPRRFVYVSLLLTAWLFVSGSVTACTASNAPPPTAWEVLAVMQNTMRESAQTLPDGCTYTRAVAPDDPAYLSDILLTALMGEAAPELTVDGVDPAPIGDIALFLSETPYPCELAVLRCSDARSTTTAAKLCRARLDTLRRAYARTEWADLVERGTVSVQGSYVLLVVCEDPRSVVRGAGVG